ncbi:MAG: transposase [Sinobacteraceae bacterium]|nr:transposase [Nevskiaceae bacterium]
MSSAVLSSLPAILTSAETKPAAKPSPRFHPVEKKRRIVEESLLPNASVARVARAHGVNANQVFFWRKQYQQGLLGAAQPSPTLLPVQISDSVVPETLPAPMTRTEGLRSAPSPTEDRPTGTIHLELAKAKLRIEGRADPACVRAVLEGLLR